MNFAILTSGPRAFIPTDATGLKLWLRADVGVAQASGVISAWNDQSGNANHAAALASPPAFVSSALAGLPVVRCVGPTGLSSATSVVTAGAARTIFLVLSNEQGSVLHHTFRFKTATPYFGLLWDLITNIYTDGVDSNRNHAVVAQTYAQPMVYEVSWDGDTTHPATFRLNGTLLATTVSGGAGIGPSSDTGTDGYLIHGSDQGSGQGADYSEIVAVDGTATAGNITRIRHYLGNKYGIAVS